MAAIDGDPVGCATVGFFEEDSCQLYRLFVDPARRREGIGAALVVVAERFARERQLQFLQIEMTGTRPFWLRYLSGRPANSISPYHLEIDLLAV